MKVVILCAGKGVRTGLNYPKCLHKLNKGESLLERNLKVIKKAGFKNKQIILATGFKSQLIKIKTKNKYVYVYNKFYNTTNMVFTLYNVIKKFKPSNYIVIYADIIFDLKSLLKIKNTKYEISTLVDKEWLKKWKKRKDYMNDLEELKISKSKIVNLGKKTRRLSKIDGRFVGISKFSKKIIARLTEESFYSKLLKKNNKIDFTNFLMILIKQGYRVDAIKRKVDWFEFDQKEDFVSFEKKTF